MARWSGLPLRDVRAGLGGIGGEIAEERVEGQRLLALKAAKPRLPATGQVRLLGAFDTYVLGYAIAPSRFLPGRRSQSMPAGA